MHDAVLAAWSTLPVEQINPSAQRRRIVGRHAMVSHITLLRGAVVASHSHANEQITCVLSGALRMGLGAEGTPAWREQVIRPGDVLLLPANLPHSAVAIEDTVVLDVFSPPSQTTGIDAHRG